MGQQAYAVRRPGRWTSLVILCGSVLMASAPVHAFKPNGYGLHNVAGNVWEWCEDYFSPLYHAKTSARNPLNAEPAPNRSLRGGSFLCHESYCNRYRVAARSSNTPDSAASNIGFRVVR